MSRKKLRWCNTRYSQSLDCMEDLAFYEKLIKLDPEAAKFYEQFHNEANTNDPKTDWGRARRNGRRRDIYHALPRIDFTEENEEINNGIRNNRTRNERASESSYSRLRRAEKALGDDSSLSEEIGGLCGIPTFDGEED